MTDFSRVLVIENGQMVFIQNENGVSVAFSSFEEAERIMGYDFSGKFYVGYEPHMPLFRDSRDESINEEMIPNILYEGFINTVSTYKARQQDPYYGFDEAEALSISKNLKRVEILAQYQVEEDLLEITYGTNNYSAGPQDIVELYVEYQLATENSEATMVVFDVDNEPRVINLDQVVPALQSMRSLAKDLRSKGKGYLADINNAATRAEVEAVVWI